MWFKYFKPAAGQVASIAKSLAFPARHRILPQVVEKKQLTSRRDNFWSINQ